MDNGIRMFQKSSKTLNACSKLKALLSTTFFKIFLKSLEKSIFKSKMNLQSKFCPQKIKHKILIKSKKFNNN